MPVLHRTANSFGQGQVSCTRNRFLQQHLILSYPSIKLGLGPIGGLTVGWMECRLDPLLNPLFNPLSDPLLVLLGSTGGQTGGSIRGSRRHSTHTQSTHTDTSSLQQSRQSINACRM